MNRVHFIAIGGSAMHNLALALHHKGLQVTGSDDEIFEPSLSRLEKYGLLPPSLGWFPYKLDSKPDAVILGMHARADNPELLRARELGLNVYSYPEFIFEQSKDKQRVVIAGSHGKTTITSMILHVLKANGKKFDYLVGALLNGFDTMVQLTDAPVIIIEGDEYFASPVDRIPKFLHYKHHIGVVSGVAWDHVNVYPDFEEYKHQFELFVQATPKAGTIIYNEDDKTLNNILKGVKRDDIFKVPYTTHKSKLKDGQTYLVYDDRKYPIRVFGDHNLMNIRAALEVCKRLGVIESDFYQAIQSFTGASNRLELLAENAETKFFRDFAHAPSKVLATTKALSAQYPKKKLVACLELHTFSSLNKEFLKQYKDTFDQPDVAIVYFNQETILHKKLEPVSPEDVKKAFHHSKLMVFNSSKELQEYLLALSYKNTNVLMMSSGNFDGINLKEFAQQIISK